eukprot:comp6580_c0_seq1/m.2357 comp6580_c0_seq1/g.2357  ORF comp6580_c0_seq1/g.2357 comp6580_c0_seq1/m.2357 type:complete len:196 (-) comp6580_c0_seq1:147-734(-)
MKINERTIIVGQNVVLVPYLKEHVPRYHEWMQSEFLQETTASEPLSIDEEYAMQKSWRDDEDKCTFIVLDRQQYDATNSLVEPMVGDVNLFFNDHDDRTAAEIEIMIAEESARGKGCGKEALQLMMQYGARSLGVTRYVSKIGVANTASTRLFTSLGYVQVSFSEVFQEVTLEKAVTNEVKAELDSIPSTLSTLP